MAKYDGQSPPVEFILTFSQLYGLEVWVHHGQGKPIQYVGPDLQTTDIKGRVHLQCLGGTHYNPAIEDKYYEPPLSAPVEEYVNAGPEEEEPEPGPSRTSPQPKKKKRYTFNPTRLEEIPPEYLPR